MGVDRLVRTPHALYRRQSVLHSILCFCRALRAPATFGLRRVFTCGRPPTRNFHGSSDPPHGQLFQQIPPTNMLLEISFVHSLLLASRTVLENRVGLIT